MSSLNVLHCNTHNDVGDIFWWFPDFLIHFNCDYDTYFFSLPTICEGNTGLKSSSKLRLLLLKVLISASALYYKGSK